ncbi:ROK family protein [Kineococcus sp. SYSU DK003]|uniref:ROK family protein n=1 Tax=Kineococcus sp. SYSU DK003 TaxID=3383124 RepID=UPI003D7E559B
MTTDSAVVLAVDVGGTGLKGAVVDAHGRSVVLREEPSRAAGRNVEENLLELLDDLAQDAAARGVQPVAVGVGAPGTVEESSGTIVYASNLGWRRFPLRAVLEEATGLPVAVGHDARAAGRAEHLASVTSGGTGGNFVFVPVGTGIAAAIVVGGVALDGARGAAGEFGHVIVHPGGEPCPCGQRGCVEAYAAGAAVLRRYTARGGRAASSTAEVVARLGADAHADAVWADAVRALALGLQGLTMLLDPAEIVLGGGVSRAGRALLDPLAGELGQLLAWRAAPPLTTARWGTGAGRIGAALLAFERAGIVPEFVPPTR